MKKVLSLFLSIAVLMSITSGLDVVAYAIGEETAESIAYTFENPIEYVENVSYADKVNDGDWWTTDGDGNAYFHYYYFSDFDPRIERGKLTVNYKNGQTVDYTYQCTNQDEGNYEWMDANGNILDGTVDFIDPQGYDHWTLGSDNYFTVAYSGLSTDVPVTIIENPVAGISYKSVRPMQIFDGSDGFCGPGDDAKRFYYYHYSFSQAGDILTVRYKDGSQTDFLYDSDKEKYVDENGQVLDEPYEIKRNDDADYQPDKDNYIEIEFLGAKTQIPVTVVENPIKSISKDTKTVNEKVFRYSDNNINYYDHCDFENDTITVNYKDGTSSVFTYFDGVGGGIDVTLMVYKDTYGNEFLVESSVIREDKTLNKTYYLLRMMGFEIEVPVQFAGDMHTHSYTAQIVPPTCTSKGYTNYVCVCGDSYADNYVNAAGHTPVSAVSARATASKDGKIAATCSVCGETLSTTVIPKASNIKLSKTSYTYNGKVQKPGVTVKDSKGKTLKNGTDYTVSYAKGRKNVGKYAVKVTFKGKYSGSKTLYFTITPKGTSLSKVTAGKKKFTVKWKKQTSQTTGYQIQYSTDKNFKKNNKTVTVAKNKTTSKTISKLKGKKKYYVRIRTYKTVKVNGKNTKIYSSWSKTKSVTTKK